MGMKFVTFVVAITTVAAKLTPQFEEFVELIQQANNETTRTDVHKEYRRRLVQAQTGTKNFGILDYVGQYLGSFWSPPPKFEDKLYKKLQKFLEEILFLDALDEELATLAVPALVYPQEESEKVKDLNAQLKS